MGDWVKPPGLIGGREGSWAVLAVDIVGDTLVLFPDLGLPKKEVVTKITITRRTKIGIKIKSNFIFCIIFPPDGGVLPTISGGVWLGTTGWGVGASCKRLVSWSDI